MRGVLSQNTTTRWKTAWDAVLVLLCLVVGLSRSTEAEQNSSHPLGIDDVLKVAVLGDAGFSSDGRWLAYTVTPPYEEMSDFSHWLSATGTSGHQLWIVDLQSDVEPKMQPGLDPDASNFYAGFSPNNAWILVLEHKFGRVRYVGCRIGRNICVRFDAQPDLRDGYYSSAFWNERIEWTSDHTFLFPARHDFLPGSERRSRGAVGQFLWRQWSSAWIGDTATATTVISTAKDRSQDWASGELLEANLETGTMKRIAEGRYAGTRISPDKGIAASARVGEREHPSRYTPVEQFERQRIFDRRFALSITDLSSGSMWQVPAPFNIDPHSITWSHNSDRVSVYGWGAGDDPSKGAFYILDIETKTISKRSIEGYVPANNILFAEPPFFAGPARTALLDEGVTVYARSQGGNRFDWYLFAEDGVRNLSRELPEVPRNLLYSDGESIAVLSDTGVLRLRASAPPQYIVYNPGGLRDIASLRRSPAHSWFRQVHFDAPANRSLSTEFITLATSHPNSSDQSIVGVDFTRWESETFALKRGDARVIAALPAKKLALVTVREGAATRLILLGEGWAPVELAVINQHLNDVLPVVTQQFGYTFIEYGAEGPPRSIEGCLTLPSGYVEGKRYPVVIDAYPSGSPRQCHPFSDEPRPTALAKDLWATRGFIHFRPEIHLDLARAPEGPIANVPKMVEQAVDALIDEGYADPNRVILFGFSQGGALSLYIAAYSDKFAAVISINGWADFFSHYFGGRGLLSYFHLDQAAGHNRWRYECLETGKDHLCPFGFGWTALEYPEWYARTSPVALAAEISAPVLLIHSDLDYFDLGQYDEMFGALYRAGKEARYVRYWGEGHAPSSPANIRDLWDQFDSFLCDVGAVSGSDVLERDCRSAPRSRFE